MTHKLGLHWIRVHPDQHDFAHVEKMQYRSVKTFEWMHKDRNFCHNLIAAMPKDAYFLARNHPRSEEKEDVWRDPVGTGIRHANAWAIDIANGECHLPIDRTFFLPVNEPDATTGDRAAIDRYTTAFLDRLRVHGLRGGAFNFSTGHPRTVDGTGATQADYTVFEGSHQAIVRGHHLAVLHIYGTTNVPCVPGHYDRLRACPWTDVEWVVGECGIDEHVIGGGPHDGYLRTLGASDAYCRWLDDFILGIGDSRIHSYQVFSYDFSHPWDSFDVRAIRPHLEAYNWQHAKQASAPHETHLPNIISEPPAPDPTPQPVDTWQRSIAFVRRWEGGWADNPHDPGGATNKGITIGTYTRWRQAHGQPAPTKDDLRNITDAEANQIYFEWYWKASGSDKLPWPLCLANFDTAVNAGPGRAAEMLQKSGGNFMAYVGHVGVWYTTINGFEHFGRAWARRRFELLLEATK